MILKSILLCYKSCIIILANKYCNKVRYMRNFESGCSDQIRSIFWATRKRTFFCCFHYLVVTTCGFGVQFHVPRSRSEKKCLHHFLKHLFNVEKTIVGKKHLHIDKYFNCNMPRYKYIIIPRCAIWRLYTVNENLWLEYHMSQ